MLHGPLVALVNEPDPRDMSKNGAYFKAITGGDQVNGLRPGPGAGEFTGTDTDWAGVHTTDDWQTTQRITNRSPRPACFHRSGSSMRA